MLTKVKNMDYYTSCECGFLVYPPVSPQNDCLYIVDCLLTLENSWGDSALDFLLHFYLHLVSGGPIHLPLRSTLRSIMRHFIWGQSWIESWHLGTRTNEGHQCKLTLVDSKKGAAVAYLKTQPEKCIFSISLYTRS